MQHIDLEKDTLITVYEASKRSFGRRVTPSTVWRWIHKGFRGVRLEAVHTNGKWYTTTAAFAAFLSVRTTDSLPADAPPPARRYQDVTDEMLRAAGLL